MAHWGWYWKHRKKHIPRTLCSQLFNLDSFKVFKRGITGFSTNPQVLRASVVDGNLRISHGKRKNYSYIIPTDKIPCHYGGFRYYFKCPACQRRMRILYLTKGAFLCRNCLDMGYYSQRLRPTNRHLERHKKITALIKQRGGDYNLYKKPPRMRGKTFDKLRGQAYYYQTKSYQALNQELRSWYGSKIESSLDTYYDYVDEKLR